MNITASIGHKKCTATKSLKLVNVPTTSTSSDFPEKQDNFPTLSILEGYGGYSISVDEQDIPQTPSKEGFFFLTSVAVKCDQGTKCKVEVRSDWST